MKQYKLREELIDLPHRVHIPMRLTPPTPDSEKKEKTPRRRNFPETDVIMVDKPKSAYTVGIRRVSVAKEGTVKPATKFVRMTVGGERSTERIGRKIERSPAEIGPHCCILHIPLGSSTRGNVGHTDEITGEDGKVVPCLLLTVDRTVDTCTIGGKQRFLPTKTFTPSKKVVKRLGGRVVPRVRNVYGDAPCNANWTHREDGRLPKDIVVYPHESCDPSSGQWVSYQAVMGAPSMTQSAFHYSDFAITREPVPGFPKPTGEELAQLNRWYRLREKGISPGASAPEPIPRERLRPYVKRRRTTNP
ncbi:hypothetical protein TWF718_002821 [Orbilia javanica]|uniref:Uncharacterized protein n=1 Tax=Orbilia javanica TaxID=47235 RepID=A0AAN8MM86_9PEZI